MPATQPMDDTMTHQVRDGQRLITFEGVLLGEVTSRRPGVARWTEMYAYRTDGGAYVLEKVGLSTVCHMPGCVEMKPGLPRFQTEHPGEDPDHGFVFHEDCVPEEYDFTRLLVEQTRYWAKITKDPAEILAALERRRDGVVTLPRIGSELLALVSAADPEFGDFWMVGQVD